MKAGLVLGAIFLVIPARWAAAAEVAQPYEPPPPVEPSTPPVEHLPPPGSEIIRPQEPPPVSQELPPVPAPDFRKLRGPAFYESVGRHDLARRYRDTRALKTTVRVLGAVAATAGALWWFADKLNDTLFEDCSSSSAPAVCNKTYWAPDVLMAASVAVIILPSFFDTDPVDADERARLYETAHARPRTTSFSLAPRLDHDGASLALTGRF
jgi:hypothetical protein